MKQFSALVFLSLCTPVFAAESSDTRYVWANSLVLRAQADGKSAEVARLPYGTAVTLLADTAPAVPRREVLLRLLKSADTPGAEVALDGTWRHVRAQDGEGWVFDGYLSRYPTRRLSSNRNKEDDEDEGSFARRLFGAKLTYKWKTGDSKKGEDYRALIRETKMTDKQTREEVTWEYAEFKSGGSYSKLSNRADGGMYASSIDFKDLPLTYGEALLWVKQFGGFDVIGGKGNGAFGKFAGKVESGKHLEIGPADDDDSGFGFSRRIDCAGAACSISYGFAD
ncbi:MAG TPA: SH3 domain-containing protein [Burkholderiaceae bacterium]